MSDHSTFISIETTHEMVVEDSEAGDDGFLFCPTGDPAVAVHIDIVLAGRLIIELQTMIARRAAGEPRPPVTPPKPPVLRVVEPADE
jgi:hypothetical protein